MWEVPKAGASRVWGHMVKPGVLAAPDMKHMLPSFKLLPSLLCGLGAASLVSLVPPPCQIPPQGGTVSQRFLSRTLPAPLCVPRGPLPHPPFGFVFPAWILICQPKYFRLDPADPWVGGGWGACRVLSEYMV